MSQVRVVHLVEDLGLGGLERVVQALARNAERARYGLEIVCAVRGGPMAAEIESEGTPVRVLGLRSYYAGDVLRAARALKAARADVVHSHGHFAGVLARAAAWWSGIPAVVHHLHTADGRLAARHRRLERLLARVTDRVLCCSRAVERHAHEDLGLSRELTLTVLNGIEPPPQVTRPEALRLLGADLTPPLVACVGGLAPHKGQEHLLRAGALLGDSFAGTLVLVGDGPERPRLEALAAACGMASRVVFLGARPDVRRLLPAFDLVVVPSVEREGLGLAALEAMDAGRPVVATRVGGLPEAIEDGRTGLLVPPRDAAALGGAIRSVLDRPDAGRSFGEAGRLRIAALFRAREMARRVESVYEEALGERRAA